MMSSSSSIRFSSCFKTPFWDYENEHEDDDEYEKQPSMAPGKLEFMQR